MNFRKLLAVVVGASALGLAQAGAAVAQETPNTDPQITGDATAPSRLNRNQEPQQQRRRTPPPPTPEQILAQAKTLLTAAGSNCQATEAASLGVTAEQQPAFEVVCAGAPGQLVVAATPPKTYDCLELAGQAMLTRESDPAADVGQQCSLPVNIDAVSFVSAWAREAGVPCTVDQASAIGKGDNGELIYEVGCANAGGYWLTKANSTWTIDPCWNVALDNQKCRFTTEDETKAAWRTIVGSTEASACDVDQARRVGRDAQGLMVYEVKCAVGDGYFVRVGSNNLAQRASACAASAHVAGGCKLTVVAPAPAPPATEE